MYSLRDYQQVACDKAMEFFNAGDALRRPVIVAPTAAGKSIYIAYLTKKIVSGVLVLQPTKELLEQNFKKFTEYGGQASIYSASAGIKEIGAVTFAMIGSIKQLASDFCHVKYIIIDECHRVPPEKGSMYMDFLGMMDADVKVLGLTATAFRNKKYSDVFTGQPYSQINLLPRERPRYFNEFLHITQIRELYDKGFLCPVVYSPLSWDKGQLRVNTTGAEYTDESVDQAVKQQKIYERLPAIIGASMEKGRKHRLVFVKSVSEAVRLASIVPNSACVSSDTKKAERSRILADFKSGRVLTVFNVGVLTEGFDFPALDTVIIARPTMSLTLYVQMIGRGIRISKEKENCVVVDMCGNYDRFGRIEDLEYTTDARGLHLLRSKDRVLTGVRLDK